MKYCFVSLMLLLVVYVVALEPDFAHDPAISPDGSTLCFSWNGDLFSVPITGGVASRLTSTPGDVFCPCYSPDGKLIAYSGNKNGYNTVFVIPATGGQALNLPGDNAIVLGWYPDGKSLLVNITENFSSSILARLYLDGTPAVQIAGLGSSYSELSPDGKSIILCLQGNPYRKNYTGSENGDLWEINLATGGYTRLTNTPTTERYPVYSRIHPGTIYFCAPRNGQFQLCQSTLTTAEKPRFLTDFNDFSVRDLSIASQSERIVFERFNQIWTWDEAAGKASKIEISINEDLLTNTGQVESYTNRADDFDLSMDGKWLLFTSKYDLFAVPEKGGDVVQITHDQPGISTYAILPDNRTFVFATCDNKGSHLFKGNITNPTVYTPMDWGSNRSLGNIRVSDDSLVVVMYSSRNEPNRVLVYDQEMKKCVGGITDERVEEMLISPDRKSIFYLTGDYDADPNLNLKMRPLDGGKAVSLDSYRKNWIQDMIWGKDNKTLILSLKGKVLRYDLTPVTDFAYDKNKDNWKEALGDSSAAQKDTKKKSKKSTRQDNAFVVQTDGFANRVMTLVDIDGWISGLRLADDKIYYTLTNNGKHELRSIGLDGKDDTKVCGLSSHWYLYSKANSRFYYTGSNNIVSCNESGSDEKTVEFNYQYRYDTRELNRRVFDEVWENFKASYYDPQMHGVDWEKSYKLYRPYVDKALTSSMLGNIIDDMVGDLNSSHTGYTPRVEEARPGHGPTHLGCEFNNGPRPQNGIMLKKVYNQSTLAQAYHARPGDVLLSLDGTEITPRVNVPDLLRDKTGQKIKFTLRQGKNVVQGELRGLTWGEGYDMRYENWVYERRHMVDSLSHGELGYLHIRSMDDECLERFYKELGDMKPGKKGIILDVRDNGGGSIHNSLIEELTKRTYAYNASPYLSKGLIPTPNNVYDLPKVLLINQDSGSDAEIFPALFKYFKLGKVIGVPTGGNVIGTSPRTLMDGSEMRMPSGGWFYADTKLDLEGNGVQPDVFIEPTPEQTIADDDVQLKAAVQELLK